jgi:hypothetical protein
LPRELRDYIYDYAFGSEAIIFTPPGLTLEAWPKGRKSKNGGPVEDIAIHYPNTLPAYTRGLPLWLLTNKQICSEALSYFGIMRTFASVDFSQIARYPTDVFPLLPDFNCPSPLVFNDDVIRDVTIRAEKLSSFWPKIVFIRFIHCLDLKSLDLGLGLECSSREYAYFKDWKKDFDAWIATCWDTGKWSGRFRKVIISISTDCDGDEPVVDTARFDQVEALARRLVGNVRAVIWSPFIFDYMDRGNKIYKRSIVVDRKD